MTALFDTSIYDAPAEAEKLNNSYWDIEDDAIDDPNYILPKPAADTRPKYRDKLELPEIYWTIIEAIEPDGRSHPKTLKRLSGLEKAALDRELANMTTLNLTSKFGHYWHLTSEGEAYVKSVREWEKRTGDNSVSVANDSDSVSDVGTEARGINDEVERDVANASHEAGATVSDTEDDTEASLSLDNNVSDRFSVGDRVFIEHCGWGRIVEFSGDLVSLDFESSAGNGGAWVMRDLILKEAVRETDNSDIETPLPPSMSLTHGNSVNVSEIDPHPPIKPDDLKEIAANWSLAEIEDAIAALQSLIYVFPPHPDTPTSTASLSPDGEISVADHGSDEAAQHGISSDTQEGEAVGNAHPSIKPINTYSPGGRKTEYFRFTYRSDKKTKHRHIPGGNTKTPLAISRAQAIQDKADQGCSTEEILQLISSW